MHIKPQGDYIDTIPDHHIDDVMTLEKYTQDAWDYTVIAGPLEVGVYRVISDAMVLENTEHRDILNSMIKSQLKSRTPLLMWVWGEMVELWVPKSQIEGVR
jgi:hypothetical protein